MLTGRQVVTERRRALRSKSEDAREVLRAVRYDRGSSPRSGVISWLSVFTNNIRAAAGRAIADASSPVAIHAEGSG